MPCSTFLAIILTGVSCISAKATATWPPKYNIRHTDLLLLWIQPHSRPAYVSVCPFESCFALRIRNLGGRGAAHEEPGEVVVIEVHIVTATLAASYTKRRQLCQREGTGEGGGWRGIA